MTKNLFNQLELLFWDFTIRVLSQFRLIRSCLSGEGQFMHISEAALVGMMIGAAGVAGLVSGCMFYFITAGLR